MNYSLLLDDNDYVFVAVTDIKYAQRFCRTLMDEMHSAFYARVPEAKDKTVSGSDIPKNFLPEIAGKYNVEKNFDKVAEANAKIDEIKIQVQDSLKKAAGDQKEMEELDRKAQDMVTNAKGFESNAKTLEKQMWWRNARLWIIIAVVILVLLIVILVPVLVSK